MTQNGRPKIGLALSGASSRSVFHIGFLEVLAEHGIRPDYIAACSGSSVVAACYACGSLEELRRKIFALNREQFFELLKRNNGKGGVYTLDKFEDVLRQLTHDAKFEDVHPLMGFVAADIDKGEQVVLSIGDIAHAARISCTVPGVFDPVQWGSRTLVDGGLLSIIPGDIARNAGMDIVIGINIRAYKHIFLPYQLWFRRILNFLKRLFLLNYAERMWRKMMSLLEQMEVFDYFSDVDIDPDFTNQPGLFSVLGKSLDLAIYAHKNPQQYDSSDQCDILIRHEVMSGRKSYKLGQMQRVYEDGRHTAEQYLPIIQQKINEFEINSYGKR